jgi:glutathione S-transferase
LKELPRKSLCCRAASYSSWEKVSTSAAPRVQAVKTQEATEIAGANMASGKIQLHSMATPNGMKVGIALEEMGLEYDAHLVDIFKNDQFSPEFVAINPNSKIPAIVDPDGPDGKPLNVFESGAILLYLAEKTGKFLSPDPRLKWETIQWLFFQMGGVGPMFGQFGHFYKYAKDKCQDPYPVTRYTNETKRLLGVLEKRLEGRDFLIDSGYSIADMATFPWVHCVQVFYGGSEAVGLEENFPKVVAWKERCASRPATAKGMEVTKKQ